MRNLILLFVILIFTGCVRSDITQKVENDLDAIVTKWVPDKREAIFTYSLEVTKAKDLVLKGETSVPDAKDEIVNYLLNAGFNLTDSLRLLPDSNETDKIWGLVTVGVCNIKNEPSHSSELVSQTVLGTPVKVLKFRGGWTMIQTPDHYIGWVTGSSLVLLSDIELQNWQQSDRLIYTGRMGDIISENNNNEIVSDITTGAVIKYISRNQDYFIVELPDGRKGRINRSETEDFKTWCDEVMPLTDKMIRYAQSFLGYPYLWGGTTTKAFDCSGFVKTIYFTGGIILARDASLQYLHGKPVDISSSYDNLIPGDLLFFGYLNDKGEERIIHVGMYIGDTEVIHASGMVQINSLDPERENYSTYLGETIKGARRVIGEEQKRGMESVRNHPWYNSMKKNNNE